MSFRTLPQSNTMVILKFEFTEFLPFFYLVSSQSNTIVILNLQFHVLLPFHIDL
jgi:hypothetical protein